MEESQPTTADYVVPFVATSPFKNVRVFRKYSNEAGSMTVSDDPKLDKYGYF